MATLGTPSPARIAVKSQAKLVALALALFAARVAWIARVPDIDMDAYGHYNIACELTRHPWNLAAHWVWLPLYHYLLAAVVLAKGAFSFVRMLSAIFIALLPIVLYRYELGREGPEVCRSRRPTFNAEVRRLRRPTFNADGRVAALSAACCAIASIPNLLGVSAQQEALFSLLILLAAWGVDGKRFWLAGCALALACLIRYEAWGAAAVCFAQPSMARLLRLWRAPSREGTWPYLLLGRPLPWAVSLPALAAMFGWILVHRVAEGTWFGFLHELYRFTHEQREAYSHGATADALWFPILLPLAAFGPAVLLFPFGLRPAFRPGFFVPLGVFAFLMISYAGKGSLGGPRYYASLTPFFASCMAHAVFRLARGERIRALLRVGLVASLTFTTGRAFFVLQKATASNADHLRAAEARTACEINGEHAQFKSK